MISISFIILLHTSTITLQYAYPASAWGPREDIHQVSTPGNWLSTLSEFPQLPPERISSSWARFFASSAGNSSTWRIKSWYSWPTTNTLALGSFWKDMSPALGALLFKRRRRQMTQKKCEKWCNIHQLCILRLHFLFQLPLFLIKNQCFEFRSLLFDPPQKGNCPLLVA